jgi:NADH-quinone oxidoreductase subunit K
MLISAFLTEIPVYYYVVISGILFAFGLYAVITRRNAVVALMGVELMLNAANINLVAFSQYDKMFLSGQMTAIFVIALAAAEAAIGLAIVLNVYDRFRTVNLDDIDTMKE